MTNDPTVLERAKRLLDPVDPNAPEPTLLSQNEKPSREMSLQQLCELHAKRTGQRILRVERD